MNDTQSSPDSNTTPLASVESAPNPAPAVNPVALPRPADQPLPAKWAYIAIGSLTVLLIASWWSNHKDITRMSSEMARRLQADDSIVNETKLLTKSLQDSQKDMQAKLTVLEAQQVQAQGQQLALEQLYQDLSKNRDDWALAEIEQVLSTASQQLQLAGNVQGALIALQNADRSLSRSDKPQFIVIRRAIAKDLETLKSLPSVDISGIAVRLDSAIGLIDSMPLLSDEKPSLPATPPKVSRHAEAKPSTDGKAKGKQDSEWVANLDDKWQSWSNEMWGEVRQLIRIRTVDTPDALLLSPTQAYYARENLKLRLLNVRLALLSRNEGDFRKGLISAQDSISKYFDTRARQTLQVQDLLKAALGSNLSIEMPTLADSLNAVRNYKAK